MVKNQSGYEHDGIGVEVMREAIYACSSYCVGRISLGPDVITASQDRADEQNGVDGSCRWL